MRGLNFLTSSFLIAATLIANQAVAQSDANSSANAAATSASTTSVAAPASTGSTTASLPTVLSDVKKSPFKFTFYTRSDIGRNSVHDGEGAPTSLNFLSGSYGLTESRSIAVRQEFSYNYPKTGTQGAGHIRDLFVGYNDTNLASFAGDGSVTGIFRVYLPTGEDSRFVSKQNGQLLSWFIVNKPLGKFELDYHLIGVYFNQSQNSYIDSNGAVQANLDYNIENWATVTYHINPELSVYQSAGTDNVWKRAIAGAGVQRGHALEMDTGLSYKPNTLLSFNASLYNYANIWDSPNAFGFYRDNETVYRLIMVATM